LSTEKRKITQISVKYERNKTSGRVRSTATSRSPYNDQVAPQESLPQAHDGKEQLMAVKILAIGDRFVLSDLIVATLHRDVGQDLEISALDLPWPIEPFGRVAEVDEASGTEELVIELVGGIEVLFTHLAPITKRVLEAADAVRLVVCPRGGPVNVNEEAASEDGAPSVTCQGATLRRSRSTR